MRPWYGLPFSPRVRVSAGIVAAGIGAARLRAGVQPAGDSARHLAGSARRCRAEPAASSADSAPAPAPPADSGPSIQLSPDVPQDVSFGSGSTLPAIQEDFDIFSWNSFIALNWPPGPGGDGDPAKKPGEGSGGDNPTVWEGYADSSAVFLPGGKTPTWGAAPRVPAACRALYQPGTKLLWQVGKTPDLLEETVQPFDTGPLIDQNGSYARFQINMNRPMFDYVLANSLYSKAGQSAFSGTVKFPCGSFGKSGPGGGDHGQGLVEGDGEGGRPRPLPQGAGARLHPGLEDHQPADRGELRPADGRPRRPPHRAQGAERSAVGVVHLRARGQRPGRGRGQAAESGRPLQLLRPDCKDCTVNEPPPRPWIPNRPGTPSQVVRLDVLPDFAKASAAEHNKTAKGLYTGVSQASVWQYYELMSTQWPTDPGTGNCEASPTDPDGNPAPQFLANTTLETYVQGTTPNVSSSCIECHGNAAMTNGAASDFTYLLERAQ